MKTQNGSEYLGQWGEFSIQGSSHNYAAVAEAFQGNLENGMDWPDPSGSSGGLYGNGDEMHFATRDKTDHMDIDNFSCKGNCYTPIHRGWWGPPSGYNPNGVWGDKGESGLRWYMGYGRHYLYPTFVEMKVRHC